MYVTEFEIESFGDGHPLRFLDLGNGLNVALAPSVPAARQLLHVIPGTLFGNARFFASPSAMVLKPVRRTALRVRTEDGAFLIERDWIAPTSPAMVTTGDGQPIDLHHWDAQRARVSPEEYSAVFTLDVRRLRRLLQDRSRGLRRLGALARELSEEPSTTRLSSGRIRKVRTNLPLNGVSAELSRLQASLTHTIQNELPTTTRQNGTTDRQERREQIRQAEQELCELREQLTATETELHQIRAALLYLPLRKQSAALELELADLPHRMATGNSDSQQKESLQQLDERIQLVTSEWKEIRAERANLAKQREELDRFRQVDELTPRLEAALWQEKPLIREEEALRQLKCQIDDLEKQVLQDRHESDSRRKTLGATVADDVDVLARLDSLADQLRDAERERSIADQALAKIETTEIQHSSDEYALAGSANVVSERETRMRVAQLRDQLDSQDDAQQLQRDRDRLEQQVQQLYREQLVPLRTVLLFGIPFALGAAMIIHALMSPTGSVNWQQVLWGFVIALVIALIKILRDRERDRMLTHARGRLARIGEQLVEYGDPSPDDEDAIAAQLLAAEQDLQGGTGQDRGPPSRTVTADRRMLEKARRRASEASARLRDLSQQWRAMLVELNLSPSLTATHAREALAERARRESESPLRTGESPLADKLKSLQQEWARRHDGLRHQANALRNLALEVGQSVGDESIGTIAEILHKAVRQAKDRKQQLEPLQRSDRRLRQRASDVRENGRRLIRQRRHLQEACKRRQARLLAQERQTAERHEQLTAARERLNREANAVLSHVGLTPGAPLCMLSEEELTARAAAASQKLTTLREQVIEQAALQGQLRGQLQLLELDEPSTVWQAASASIRPVVDDLQRLHERVRSFADQLEAKANVDSNAPPPQSRYLRIASRYLRRLSQGECSSFTADRANRQFVWTDRRGRSSSLQELPQEELADCYVALWLARLEQYADRGIRFPIILHDPLAIRASRQKTVIGQTLRQVSTKSHQMLLVTSVPGNASVLAELGVPIADLTRALSAP